MNANSKCEAISPSRKPTAFAVKFANLVTSHAPERFADWRVEMSEQDMGRVPSAPGSHPSGHAAYGVDGASRFDPSRKLSDELRTGRGISERQSESGGTIRDAWVHDVMQRAADEIDRLKALADDYESRIKAARHVIAYGYRRVGADGRTVDPLRNSEQCSHGRYEWEDCIGCYDEALSDALDGVTRDSDRNPEGEKPKALSAEHESAGLEEASPNPKSVSDSYRDADLNALREAAYKRGRRDGGEDAAKVAETKFATDRWAGHYRIAGKMIAAAIRSLVVKPSGSEHD